MAKVFFSYSHKDIDIRDEIDRHFSVMKRSGLIQTWYDREIEAGNEFDLEIKAKLENSDIILLLVSSDFLDSSYCQDVEMKRALEKHRAREARVVPIIVDVCDWKHTNLKKLKSLPNDGKPIKKYKNRREAYQDITNEIRRIANRIHHPYQTFIKDSLKLVAPNPTKNSKKLYLKRELIYFLKENPKIFLGTLLIFFAFFSLGHNNNNKTNGASDNNASINSFRDGDIGFQSSEYDKEQLENNINEARFSILCISDSGREDVTITESPGKSFGKILNCLSGGDFIMDLTPCAPKGEYALSAPTGTVPIIQIVPRWQDYANHSGGVTLHYIRGDTIGFSGGFNWAGDGYTEQWNFEANRLTGIATLKEENGKKSTYKCKKLESKF
ncbi:toll/interleukin-1 receptor domain-containing protein [Thiothrix nivea]|uniref:TIR protein n=1 Tax=Thiothrix nivea (strain ATCC 35100 / DSM 5205 / JP2) TaxID=870187 RepID=A0A656HM88_THINJ|nr:toll/interleukin-1 receptor domain-containing protein [Thiothrix nivea]EIJ36460.1 TIR protein [Thiothrix nivea DSM 5205]